MQLSVKFNWPGQVGIFYAWIKQNEFYHCSVTTYMNTFCGNDCQLASPLEQEIWDNSMFV